MIEDQSRSVQRSALLKIEEKPVVIKARKPSNGVLTVLIKDQVFATVARGEISYTEEEVGQSKTIVCLVVARPLPVTAVYYVLEYPKGRTDPRPLDVPLVISEGVIPHLTVDIEPC